MAGFLCSRVIDGSKTNVARIEQQWHEGGGGEKKSSGIAIARFVRLTIHNRVS